MRTPDQREIRTTVDCTGASGWFGSTFASQLRSPQPGDRTDIYNARIADLPDRISHASFSYVLDHLGFGDDQLIYSRWHGKPIGGVAISAHHRAGISAWNE